LNHHLLAGGFLNDQRGTITTASHCGFPCKSLKWPKLALTTELQIRITCGYSLIVVGQLRLLPYAMAPASLWHGSELLSADVVDTPVVIILFQEPSQHLLLHVSPNCMSNSDKHRHRGCWPTWGGFKKDAGSSTFFGMDNAEYFETIRGPSERIQPF